jgi:malate dehydrogenase (oxaloacetate-decarboxylating)
VCRDTNADNVRGGIDAALRGADVCIAFSSSGPGVINPEWIRGMKRDAIVFACANPVPEIWPADAKKAGARIVATGRSDMPNQVNNALVFPGIFRGVLDVRASTISDDMAIAAAHALAAAIPRKDLSVDRILPSLDEPHVAAEVAAAAGVAAQEKGLAQVKLTRDELRTRAVKAIAAARAATQLLMKERQIASAPAP